MKNNLIKYISRLCLAAILPAMLMAGCSDDDTDGKTKVNFRLSSEDPAVEISTDGTQATMEIAPLGGEITLSVATGVEWTVATDPDDEWLVVTGSGSKLTVRAPEFVSDYVRRSMVRILYDSTPIGYINVSQAGTEVATLVLSDTDVEFTELGGTRTITVETNRETWHVEGFDGNGWLEYDTTADGIVLTAITNEVAREFSTVFTVVAGTDSNSRSREVSVSLGSWSPAYIDAGRDIVVVPEEGGKLELGVDSNREWTVSTDDTWFTVAKENGKLIVDAMASSSGVLEGTITITTTSGRDSAEAEIDIRQYTNPYTLEYTIPEDNLTVGVPIAGTVNCYVDWGDGTGTGFAGEIYTGGADPVPHTYEKKGVYTVKIYGTAEKLNIGVGDVIRTTAPCITAVKSWGDLGARDLQNMLMGTSIKTITEGYSELFQNATNLSGVFWNCTGITEIPADLLNNIQSETVVAFFFGCTGIKTVPSTLLKGATNVRMANTMFRECSGLETIPVELFSECPNLEDITATFMDCRGLKSVPAGIFDNNRNLTSMYGLFMDCTSLTGSSPYTNVAGENIYMWMREPSNGFAEPTSFVNCFAGCTKLSDYANIPDEWK